MSSRRVVWPRSSRPQDFDPDGFEEEIKGHGMNRVVPEVQVLMEPSWIKFDSGYFSGQLDGERDERGSQSSLEPALGLTPLSMAVKRLKIREKVNTMASQAVRQAYLIRHWKEGLSTGGVKTWDSLVHQMEGYVFSQRSGPTQLMMNPDEDFGRAPLLLDKIFVNGGLDMEHWSPEASRPASPIMEQDPPGITGSRMSQLTLACPKRARIRTGYRSQFPKHLQTGEDAVRYFMSLPESTGLFIHCNLRQQKGLDYDPYDLVVVEQHVVEKEYFLISDRGVTHIQPKEASDVTYHHEWIEERTLFMLLKKTKFFGMNTLVKWLKRWKKSVLVVRRNAAKESLQQNLFCLNPVFSSGYSQMKDMLGVLKTEGRRYRKREVGRDEVQRYAWADDGNLLRDNLANMETIWEGRLPTVLGHVGGSQTLHTVREFSSMRERIVMFSSVKINQIVASLQRELLCVQRQVVLEVSRLSPSRLSCERWQERLEKEIPMVTWRNHSLSFVKEQETVEDTGFRSAVRNYEQFKRLLRKMDIMLVHTLVEIGQDACSLALEEMTASRRQGLFIVNGRIAHWADTNINSQVDSHPSSNSFCFNPSCDELLRTMKNVIREIMGVLGATTRILLMPEFSEHMAQWQLMAEKGKIAATTDLLYSMINMEKIHEEIERRINEGFTAIMRDKTMSSLMNGGTVCAFSFGFTPEEYVASDPSSEDYLKDIDCLEAWIECLYRVRPILCRGPINLELKILKDKLTPVAENTLRDLTLLADKVLTSNCESLISTLKAFTAELSVVPTELSRFSSFVDTMQGHLVREGVHRKDIISKRHSAETLYSFFRKKSLTANTQGSMLLDGQGGQLQSFSCSKGSDHSQMGKLWGDLLEWIKKYKAASENARFKIEELKPGQIQECAEKVDQLKNELLGQLSRLRKGKLTDICCSVEVAQRDINHHRSSIASAQESIAMYKSYYKKLGHAQGNEKIQDLVGLLEVIEEVMKLRKSFWVKQEALLSYEGHLHSLDVLTTSVVDVERLSTLMQDLVSEVVKIEEKHLGDDVMDLEKSTQQEARLAASTRSELATLTKQLRILRILFDPVVKVKHRRDLLRQMGVQEAVEVVMEMVDEVASGEGEITVAVFLRRTLQVKNTQKMMDHVLQLASEEDKVNKEILKAHEILSCARISSTNDSMDCRVVLNLLEIEKAVSEAEKILDAASMSPWLAGVMEALEKEIHNLVIASKAVQATRRFQELYLLLWSIFSSASNREKLLVEYREFEDCQSIWFDILRCTMERRGQLLMCIQGPRDLTECSILSKRMEEVLRSSYRILEAMRSAFPRLHFVGDDQLLKCLTSQSPKSPAFMSIIQTLFPGVRDICIEKKEGGIEVVKMVEGKHGERMRLISGVELPGENRLSEDFLKDLGHALATSVFEWTRHCLDSWDKSKAVSADRLSSYPCQCLLLSNAVQWAKGVEEALDKVHETRMDQIEALIQECLSLMEDLCREMMSARRLYRDTKCFEDVGLRIECLQRIANTRMLISTEVCHREVLESLRRDEVSQSGDFVWFSQIRYSWTPNPEGTLAGPKLRVRLGDISMDHANEYYSGEDVASLLTVPLTPKELLSLASAIGTAPCTWLEPTRSTSFYGMETWDLVRASAAAFGRCCVEIPCCIGRGFGQMMEHVLTGLHLCGAWGILCHADLLRPHFWSWLSSRISGLESEVKEEVSDMGALVAPLAPRDFMLFLCEGRRRGSPQVAQRMTSGRSDSNRQFRSVSIPIAEPVKLLIEITLRRIGFRNASDGAKLALRVMREAHDRLPGRSEYDFGLRTAQKLADYLVAAGGMEYCEVDGDGMGNFEDCQSSGSSDDDAVEFVSRVALGFLYSVVHPNDKAYVEEIVEVFKAAGFRHFLPSRTAGCDVADHCKDGIAWEDHEGVKGNWLQDAYFRTVQTKELVSTAVSILDCLKGRKHVVILGPPRCGKTMCQEYLIETLVKNGHEIEVSKIYPAALAMEGIWGEGSEAKDGQSQTGIGSNLQQEHSLVPRGRFSKEKNCFGIGGIGDESLHLPGGEDCVKARKDGRYPSRVMVLDGPVDWKVSDVLVSVMRTAWSNAIVRSPAVVDEQDCVIWETDDLSGASPVLCTAPIVHVGHISPRLEDLVKKVMKDVEGRCRGIRQGDVDEMDTMVVDAINECTAHVAYPKHSPQSPQEGGCHERSRERTGWRVLTLFSSLVASAQDEGKEKQILRNIWMALIYSLTWGIGCCAADETSRSSIESSIRKTLSRYTIIVPLPERSLYHSIANFSAGEWQEARFEPNSISQCTAAEYCGWILASSPLDSVMIASRTFLKAGCSIVLSGPPCSGNSTLACLLKNDMSDRMPNTSICITKGLKAKMVREMLVNYFERAGSTDCGGPGKIGPSLIFVDDLFQPNEHGLATSSCEEDLSISELLRECLDSQGFIHPVGERFQMPSPQILGTSRATQSYGSSKKRLWAMMDQINVSTQSQEKGILTPVFPTSNLGIAGRKLARFALRGCGTDEVLECAADALEGVLGLNLPTDERMISRRFRLSWVKRIYNRFYILMDGLRSRLSKDVKRDAKWTINSGVCRYVAVAMAQSVARESYDVAKEVDGKEEALKGILKSVEPCVENSSVEMEYMTETQQGASVKDEIREILASTVRRGVGLWVLSRKLFAGRNALEDESGEFEIPGGLRVGGRVSDLVVDEKVANMTSGWFGVCRGKATEVVCFDCASVVMSELLMPWEFGNIALVGRSCKEKRSIAKTAASQLSAKWVAPEPFENHKGLMSSLRLAMDEVRKIVVKEEASVIVYLSKEFSEDEGVLCVLQNMMAGADLPLSGESVRNTVFRDVRLMSPTKGREVSEKESEVMKRIRERLRIVVSVGESQYEAIMDSHPGLLLRMSRKVISTSGENEGFADFGEYVGESSVLKLMGKNRRLEAGVIHKEGGNRGLSQSKSRLNASGKFSQLTEEDRVAQEDRSKSMEMGKCQELDVDESMDKATVADDRHILVECLTELHRVSERQLKVGALPQSKLDDALVVFHNIYSMCWKSGHRYRSQHVRSLGHLDNIVQESKQGDIRIRDCRKQIQDLDAKKMDLKDQLVKCEKKVGALCRALETKQKNVAEEIKSLDDIKTAADSEINSAGEEYEKAVDDVLSLADADINEIKGYLSPPTMVQLVMEGICIIFDYTPDWANAKRLLNDSQTTMKQRMRNYKVRSLPESKAKKLQQIAQNSDFNPETVRLVCGAAESLCSWVVCVLRHYLSARDIQKRYKCIEKKEVEVVRWQKHMRTLRRELRTLRSQLDELKEEHDETLQRKEDVEYMLRHAINHSDQSKAIVEKLEQYKEGWGKKVKEIEESLGELFGNSVLAAFCVVHWGPLGEDERRDLLVAWIQQLSVMEVDYTRDFNLCHFISGSLRSADDKFWSPTVIADDFLKENLLIAGLAPNAPLLIDPDMEAITLIKSMDTSSNWTHLSSDNPTLSEDTLSAIAKGGKVILELREDAPYSQQLHDTAIQFHAVYHSKSNPHQEKNHSPNIKWNVKDKKLFLFTCNPRYSGNDWSSGFHSIINFGHGEGALHLRILSLISHAVSPDFDMRHRQARGSLARTKAAINKLSDGIVTYVSEAESGLVQNMELLDILMDRTSELAQYQSDIGGLHISVMRFQQCMDCFNPLIDAVTYLHSATNALARRIPTCEMPFGKFLWLLRVSVSVALEDPDILQAMKNELEGSLHERNEAAVTDGSLTNRSLHSERSQASVSDTVNQLTKALCGVMTLLICNRWPIMPSSCLKLQIAARLERDNLTIDQSELDFFNGLLSGSIAPPSWGFGSTPGIQDKNQIEKVIFSLLHHSEEFTRATISVGCLSKELEIISGLSDSPIPTLQWLEQNYPLSTFQSISSSFENKVTEFRWKSVLLDDKAFDSESCLVPDAWRGHLSPIHLAILAHLLVPQHLTRTVQRLWDAVMGPAEDPTTAQRLLNTLSTLHSSTPVLLLSQSDRDSVWLLRKLAASSQILSPRTHGHDPSDPSKLSIVSARSFTWKAAEESLVKWIQSEALIGITDLTEDISLCRNILKFVTSIPKTMQTGFRLFLCTTPSTLDQFPGSLCQGCVLFTVEEPRSLRLELHHALETLAALPVSGKGIPSLFGVVHRSESIAQGNLKAAQQVLITARKHRNVQDPSPSGNELGFRIPRTPTSPVINLSLFDTWRRLSFGLALAYASLKHIHRGKFHKETYPTSSDLLRGIQYIWRTLEDCSSRHFDPLLPNLITLRISLGFIVFARMSTADQTEVDEMLKKFFPDDILTSDAYPWSFFNDIVEDDEENLTTPEPLPAHGTLESFKQYVDNHLITGTKSILKLCPDHAYLMMVHYASDSVDLWNLIAKTSLGNVYRQAR